LPGKKKKVNRRSLAWYLFLQILGKRTLSIFANSFVDNRSIPNSVLKLINQSTMDLLQLAVTEQSNTLKLDWLRFYFLFSRLFQVTFFCSLILVCTTWSLAAIGLLLKQFPLEVLFCFNATYSQEFIEFLHICGKFIAFSCKKKWLLSLKPLAITVRHVRMHLLKNHANISYLYTAKKKKRLKADYV